MKGEKKKTAAKKVTNSIVATTNDDASVNKSKLRYGRRMYMCMPWYFQCIK